MSHLTAINDDERSCDSSSEHSITIINVQEQELSPKSARNIRRKVTWNPTVDGRSVLHINDFTGEEVEATWFHTHDFEAIRTDIKLAVALIERGDLPQDTLQYTKRGLEYRTEVGAQLRADNKTVARDAVLDEQDDQWDAGIFDSETLSRIYISRSCHCQVEARQQGLQDESDVHELHTRTATAETGKLGASAQPPYHHVKVNRHHRLMNRSFSNAAA
jgi:hypothetical protein